MRSLVSISFPLACSILVLYGSFVDGKVIKQTGNTYGDEIVLPEGGGAQLQTNTAPEITVKQVLQPSVDNAKVHSSGYRMKRNNAYGDETVLPAGGGAQSYSAAVEQAPISVQQAGSSQTGVEHSGYRLKRDNSYGDELVTPVGGGAQAPPSYSAAVEQAPATVEQPAAANAGVQSSGY